MLLVYIAVGGAMGALARWGLTGWVGSLAGEGFPWGTFAVNLIGCFLLGFMLQSFESVDVSTELRGFTTVGLFGAFTTFSTFSVEALALIQDGAWARAGAYMAGSVLLGVVGALAGIILAGAVFRLMG